VTTIPQKKKATLVFFGYTIIWKIQQRSPLRMTTLSDEKWILWRAVNYKDGDGAQSAALSMPILARMQKPHLRTDP
jgi:hypothetical protein